MVDLRPSCVVLLLACRPMPIESEPPPESVPAPESEPPPESEPLPSPTLVLRGTITALEPVRTQAGDKAWAVTLAVDEVVEGSFAGPTFAFLVHSPSKSKLALGQAIALRATWTGEGYFIDPYQW